MSRVYLKVPFAEKDDAKALGARWDGVKRQWFAPQATHLHRFQRWLDKPVPEETTQNTPQKGQGLSDFLFRVRRAVQQTTPDPVWIRAEVMAVKARHWGDVFLDLCETEGDRQIARTPAKLPKQDARRVLSQCQEAGVTLQAGVNALLLISAELHMQYGLQLKVHDIDPAFTLGDQEAKRRKVLSDLKELGISQRNIEKPVPRDFLRVGVLSPSQSAAIGDFDREAAWLEHHGLCFFQREHAIFQGPSAESSLSSAFDRLLHAHNIQPFDCIVIIRGGGATTDLAWLDNMPMANRICNAPLPVFTGLGHERDISVLDKVAHRSFDTPSKVSLHIRDTILEQGYSAIQAHETISESLQRILAQAKSTTQTLQQIAMDTSSRMTKITLRELNQQRVGLLGHSHSFLRTAKHAISNHRVQMEQSAPHLLQRSRRSLTAFLTESLFQLTLQKHRATTALQVHETIQWYSTELVRRARETLAHQIALVVSRKPIHILQHGFAIIRSNNNTAITSANDAINHKQIQVEFHDGRIMAQDPTPYQPTHSAEEPHEP